MTRVPTIAIVGMACRYPDARSPAELWENVLSQRRAFRRIPAERLRLEDYYSADRRVPDATYADRAAVIEGYAFDRVHFRVSGSAFRSADLAHWLALDVAEQALADAGFPAGEGLRRETTGVLLGNTLTGEFSRSNVMRLRWPYVRRVVEAGLKDSGWSAADRAAFLEKLEPLYKEPFPTVGEETLAGGLSNTIAGRICNVFDFKGGGYTVDGACAASLLAVTTACTQLSLGDLDVALAGGVDLSLDPFELVGFAKTGALAPEMMRVYDARSAGFWPGEGCGFVTLMRHEDAIAEGRPVYAVIRGWGISSDGSGGITRPEVNGQLLALERAYRKAGVPASEVTYFEGHGTGTEVGDATELRVLSRAHGPDAPPAAVGSIKAIMGHTKAAAGVAGLLKATLAIHHQVIPPTTGCETPHPVIAEEGSRLRVLRRGETWPRDRRLLAGVSAMGFGGINSHLVVESARADRRNGLTPKERLLLGSPQDAELFVLGDADREGLRAQVEQLLQRAAGLSLAEMGDLGAALARKLPEASKARLRAAVVAKNPAELDARLRVLAGWLDEDVRRRIAPDEGVFLGRFEQAPRIVFLFTGQGSPANLGGGLWSRRFEDVARIYERAALPESPDGVATQVAQPAICAASFAGLRVLERLGVTAAAGVGHSLGELTALAWAGAYDGDALLRIAAARGRAMADFGSSTGTMASLSASETEAGPLLEGTGAVVAGINGPRHTVVSGSREAVLEVQRRAREQGIRSTPLAVSHAFHSPLVAAAEKPLAEHLARETFSRPVRHVVSTVTGRPLEASADLVSILRAQVTAPVRFREALLAAAQGADLLVEVGPGSVLTQLARINVEIPAVAIDAGSDSIAGLLSAVASAYVLGAPANPGALFEDRFTRPLDLERPFSFFTNPCERAPASESGAAGTMKLSEEAAPKTLGVPETASVLELLKQLVADRAELPKTAVHDDHRLLGDLNLNSIVVGQMVAEASKRLGLPPPVAPTEFSGATVREVAEALESLVATWKESGGKVAVDRDPQGVAAWVRPFTVDLIERPLRPSGRIRAYEAWRLIAPAGHPLREGLSSALSGLPGKGIVLCLSRGAEDEVALLLQAARAVLEDHERRFVLVQHGGAGAAFARTVHLECAPEATVVVDVDPALPGAVKRIVAEIGAAQGYVEAHLGHEGARRVPVLKQLSLGASGELPLGSEDVLLVTGGGKGIASECALALAEATGARLVLLGRSLPEKDAELSKNLRRMEERGVRFTYLPCDVCDQDAVRARLAEAERLLGPVTAFLHGAGINVPRLLGDLDEATFRKTIAPKVTGARNVLAAVDPSRLRLFVTFGSLIARTGMPGEADYGFANALLDDLTASWQAEHPGCRSLCVSWSVWSGMGMGERLGRLESLARQGIASISPESGIALLLDLLRRPSERSSIVVTSRFGDPPTLLREERDLPLLRFLEKPRVHVPGVELVADVELTQDADPYLADHVFQGQRLFPAVMGLEAMAEAVLALTGRAPAEFRQVRFRRPIVLSGDRAVVRVAALSRNDDEVALVLRSAETDFAVDHFEATARLSTVMVASLSEMGSEGEPVPMDPQRELYGTLFFHAGRFKRLKRYLRLEAKACLAEIAGDGVTSWFGRYLPADLVLGDPGARDAAIHAVQACIPQATLLPESVERIVLGDARDFSMVRARELSREGDAFDYELTMLGEGGAVERWEGLRLRMMASPRAAVPWPEPLLGPYLERRLAELVPGSAVRVVVETGSGDKADRGLRALRRMMGQEATIRRRPDGKPEIDAPWQLSLSHQNGLTLAVIAEGPVGCDVESSEDASSKDWASLLGPERSRLAERIASETREPVSVAATRVWSAIECLKKSGELLETPLTLLRAEPDSWVLLRAGEQVVATCALMPPGSRSPLHVAVLLANGNGR